MLTRRKFLRGVLAGSAVTVGLPVFEKYMHSSGKAFAAGNGFPRRFGMFFWGNGNIPERWNPVGQGTEWELSEQLMPLANIKSDLTVVSGMNVKTGNIWPHGSGPAGLLSGSSLLERGENTTFAGPSIDQVIAQAIGSETRFRSLEFGAAPQSGLSYNGPDSINPPESSPLAMYERIFGAGFRAPGEEGQIDPKIALRRSVLDAVMEDTRQLQNGLGATDRARLEQHLTGVRELELRLARLEEDPPSLAACMRPGEPLPDYPDIDGRPQLSAANRAMCDMVAMTLACDQTRVFSNWFTHPVNNLLFQGATAGHHSLTHDEPGDQPQVHAILLQIMAEFGYLIEALRAVPEGDGTLLDNCLVLGTTDCSLGKVHLLDDYPILLAGTACGTIRKGIHYRSSSGENASKVMLSILRAMGVNRASYGTEGGFVDQGLSAIEV